MIGPQCAATWPSDREAVRFGHLVGLLSSSEAGLSSIVVSYMCNEPPLRVHSRFKKPAYNSLTN